VCKKQTNSHSRWRRDSNKTTPSTKAPSRANNKV
jgi:hypothetical protein